MALKRASLVALGGVFLAGLLLGAPPQPVLEPDSASYLSFAPFRSALYPLFLAAFGSKGAFVVQPVLAAIALVYLGWEVLALSGSLGLAAGVMAAIAVNGPLDRYHWTILTESLFVSLLTVLLGLLLRLCRRPSATAALLASATAGLAIALRPAGWFLLPLLVIVVPLRRMPARFLPLLTIPLLLITAAEHQYSGGGSTLTRQLFGKAGMIEASPGGSETAAAVVLERDFAPVRALLAEAPDADAAAYLSLNYETCLEYACSAALGIDPASDRAKAAALARIRANPAGFLALAWRNYRALWTVYGASHPGEPARIAAFVAPRRPLPFESSVEMLIADIRPVAAALVLQPLVRAIGLVTAGLALAGLGAAIVGFPVSPPWAAAMIAALAVHGGLALVALTGVGIPRYMLALWPAMMVALGSAGWALWMGRRVAAFSARRLFR